MAERVTRAQGCGLTRLDTTRRNLDLKQPPHFGTIDDQTNKRTRGGVHKVWGSQPGSARIERAFPRLAYKGRKSIAWGNHHVPPRAYLNHYLLGAPSLNSCIKSPSHLAPQYIACSLRGKSQPQFWLPFTHPEAGKYLPKSSRFSTTHTSKPRRLGWWTYTIQSINSNVHKR